MRAKKRILILALSLCMCFATVLTAGCKSKKNSGNSVESSMPSESGSPETGGSESGSPETGGDESDPPESGGSNSENSWSDENVDGDNGWVS